MTNSTSEVLTYHTYNASHLRKRKLSFEKYMKESAEIMRDLDPYHTRLFTKDITGQHSTKMPSEYPAHVISVNATQLFITPLPSLLLL